MNPSWDLCNRAVNTAVLIATIAAIWFGPIRAVTVTRTKDEERAVRARKYEILSDLMRTRQARIDPLHVTALNLVELEFYGVTDVLTAYRSYARHLNSAYPSDDVSQDRHFADGDDLFTEMLSQIAKNLGYNFDKRDLSRLGYLPVGLSNYYNNSHANAQLLREVLEGRRPIGITNIISDQSQFPPVPSRRMLADRIESGGE